MTHINVGPGKWSTGCAVLLSAAVLLCAAPASADPTDDAFVAALAKDGIVFTDRNAAIAKAAQRLVQDRLLLEDDAKLYAPSVN